MFYTPFVLIAACLVMAYAAYSWLGARHQQRRKQAYQKFLVEDRLDSTLEYQHDVTRQRRDARVWR